jgi:uncharacterized SAM-binding protein YcdF (DUF218 family)
LLILLHAPILAALGSYLVNAGPPQQADIAFVLAGDPSGSRILKASELVRQGFAPKLIVSGPSGNYGWYECDLAIPFAVKAGYPESYFVHFEHDSRSTMEEARLAVAKLKQIGVKRVLVVTSDYHTRRTGKIFRALQSDLVFDVVAAPDNNFKANGWWHSREGRKTFMFEWMKTIAEWIGL